MVSLRGGQLVSSSHPSLASELSDDLCEPDHVQVYTLQLHRLVTFMKREGPLFSLTARLRPLGRTVGSQGKSSVGIGTGR
jgi:hypothetical protein